ncbi:MAG: preprotein translocase subunit SecE, partial [Candidatus Sericytochromatia bacterium]
MIKKTVNFISEVKEELSKISYPDKEAVKNATKSVVIIVFFTAIYMEVLDFLIKSIYKF